MFKWQKKVSFSDDYEYVLNKHSVKKYIYICYHLKANFLLYKTQFSQHPATSHIYIYIYIYLYIYYINIIPPPPTKVMNMRIQKNGGVLFTVTTFKMTIEAVSLFFSPSEPGVPTVTG